MTVFMGSPKWFQNRYTLMVNQVLQSLPTSWKAQIFYVAGKPMAVEGTRYPGIQKLIRRGRVVLTPFPPAFNRLKKKDIMLQPWLWRSMLADTVLLFGGSTVLCANSDHEISDFTDFDFLGGPWSAYRGSGGDGALSVRNRTLMVRLLETVILEGDAAAGGGGNNLGGEKAVVVRRPKAAYAKREEAAFLDAIKDTAPEGARVAAPADTRRFVATEGWWDGTSRPFGGVGTIAGLNHSTRQQFLDFCPELKMLFPVLHYPDCFGAEPSPLGCIKALCDHGGIRCAEEIIKQKRLAADGHAAAAAATTSVSTEWRNVKRNIKLHLTIEEVAG